MHETATKLLESRLPLLAGQMSHCLLDATDHRGDLTVTVEPKRLREVIEFLQKNCEPRFNVMMDLFVVDYLKFQPEQPERFAVIYNLYSLLGRSRVFLKIWVNEEKPEIDSIHDLYKAANWFEREAWDLFGVVFRGHPNLVRILCHNEFEGHPLRKDYPSDHYQRLKQSAPSTGF